MLLMTSRGFNHMNGILFEFIYTVCMFMCIYIYIYIYIYLINLYYIHNIKIVHMCSVGTLTMFFFA